MRSEESRIARLRLSEDLYFAIKQDKDLCEEILDEYTYFLTDQRVDELIQIIETNFGLD